jgi:phage shock protein PspC (stress-responsive transcriptional regulator)
MIAAMTNASAHLLRRRSSDRVIGGVAGGLGDYFNVDPLLIRIGFAGLMIFGGAGLVLYLLAWALLPAEGQEHSMAETFIRALGLTPRLIVWVVVALLALVVIQAALTPGGYLSFGYEPYPVAGLTGPTLLAVAVIVAGIFLIGRRSGGASTAAAASEMPPAPVAAVAVRRLPKTRSPLGWYVVGAVLLTVGGLAMVTQLAAIRVLPGQFFGAALAVVGIGLVIGAWWGRARILILLALLLIPLAVPASFVTAPLEGGLGDLSYAPANAAELQAAYRLTGGRLRLDLTSLSVPAQPTHIAASVAVGQLVVLVPDGASVEIEARTGAGTTSIFGARQAGTELDDRYVRRHAFGPLFILDLQAGLGDVQVVAAPPRSAP